MKRVMFDLSQENFDAIRYALNELSCRRQEQSIDRKSKADAKEEAEQLRALNTYLLMAWNNPSNNL